MTLRLLGMVSIAAAGAFGRNPDMQPVVIVRVTKSDPSEFWMLAQAKSVASGLLDKAGVRVDWDRRCASAEAITIQMDDNAPRNVNRWALACALPFAKGPGPRIHVFRERIQNPPWLPSGTVLGYVMAHEIGHVLEGFDHHSQTGLMKARWQIEDYRAMQGTALRFEALDVQWIQMGARATVISR
jgi:hypothetical protein